MLRILILWIVFLTITGCVGSQIKPNRQLVDNFNNVYVVPMEAPPLRIPGGYSSSGDGRGSIVYSLPRYTGGMARGVGVLSSIAAVIELSASSNLKVDYPPMVQPNETWLPTVVLADEVRRVLNSVGRESTVSTKLQPIPGVQNRERTALMENWMAPIRSWYNDDSQSSRYVTLTETGIDLVIEIGISNFEIFADKLLFQVHLKLIEPSSGKLIGRSRASSFTPLAPMDELFSNDAAQFKAAVAAAGKELVEICLRELELVVK